MRPVLVVVVGLLAEDGLDVTNDERRARDSSAPLLPSEIKVSISVSDLNVNLKPVDVNLKPSAGVLIDYNSDGTVAGTRPRSGKG